MLIRLPRHSAADLEAWERLERSDAVHCRTRAFAVRVERAMDAILEFARGNEYAGVSWGKDSTVLAHLVWRAGVEHGVEIPLVWIKVRPIYNPHCELVRDAFLSRFAVRYDEIVSDCWRDESGWHARGTLERGFAEAARRHGRRHVSGVRGEESSQRTLRMRRFGVETDSTCAPLGWWSAQDVYAHLYDNDLPVHPAYAMSLGGLLDRSYLRVASLGGERGTGWGRAEIERRYYREEWAAIDRLRELPPAGRPAGGAP